MYNVKDFGAKGDGSVLDTAAIQAAIDACEKEGGGTVFVPAGRYISHSIYLKSDMMLYLESGAVIETDPTAGGKDGVYDAGLIILRHAKHVKICGGGRLFGNDSCFVTEMKPEEKRISGPWAHPIMYKAMPDRPLMLLLEDSEYVDVEGITISNSPVYAAKIDRCHHMNFIGVHVLNRGDMPNSDGFHFGSCTYVNVVGCEFICGDDCIAIDSCRGGESHHFTISGCNFDSTVNAFRIFTGLDAQHIPDYPHLNVHDVVACGCSCNCSGVFNLTALNGDIYNVSMNGFAINTDPERLGNCAYLMTHKGGKIYDCMFSNVVARHNGAVTIIGEDGYSIHDIDFDNWRMCITPMEKGYGMDMPDPLGGGYWLHHYAPYGVYLRHAKDIRFRNVNLTWGEGGNVKLPLPAMKIDRCENIETNGLNDPPKMVYRSTKWGAAQAQYQNTCK